MSVRIRIIPATIATATLLIAVKLVDVMRGSETLSNDLLITNVSAEDTPKAPEKPMMPADAAAQAVKPAEEKAAEAAAPAAATPEAKPEETKKDEPKKDESKPEEAKKDEGKKDEGKKDEAKGEGDKKKNPNVSDTAGDTIDHRYTAVEVELLQNLSKRREELDRWEKNIQIKEEALGATEKRIDDKIAQIDAMKKEVAGLLAQYNEKEDAKIRSLVKIYENMKPDDAARIFDEVEMPILLLVIDKMSEKKAAPILAKMDAKKAKQITVELAAQRRVSSQRLSIADSMPKAQ